jgi:septal ring factor EnvC (AmiA/AmiB activator)
MRHLLALVFLLPMAAHAIQPPQLASLEHQLALTQKQLDELENRLASTRKQHQKAVENLNAHTVALLRLAQWPWGLQVAQDVTTAGLGHTTPPLPGLVRATGTFTNQAFQTNQKQLKDYLALHQGARATQAELGQLAAKLSTQRKRLTRPQTAALNEALLEADHLAAILQSTLGQPQAPAPQTASLPSTPAPQQPSSRLSPVPGVPTPGEDGLTYHPPINTPVVATLAGRVAYSGPFRGFGGLVIVAGNNGLHAVYAGLGTLEVAVGQQVEAGTRLGQMPPTGEPRLYVELRRRGKPLRQR